MPENPSEIKILTSNRDWSKNHKENNLTEIFCQNSYVKTIEFQVFRTFSKIQNQIKEGIFFCHFCKSVKVKAWALKHWPDRHVWRPARLRVKERKTKSDTVSTILQTSKISDHKDDPTLKNDLSWDFCKGVTYIF